MLKKVLVLLPVGLVLLVGWARPMWSADGHRMICDVAWRYMTADARAMAETLRRSEASTPFADVCTWADEVRPDRPETSSFHFVNIPPGLTGVDLSRDCADTSKRCAPWAVKHYGEILADRNAIPAERLEALKFVAHFVGDLHQPLHAGRLDDLGGNNVRVGFFGDRGTARSPMQLHRVWDSALLTRAGIRWPDGVARLVAEIRPEDVAAWSHSDVIGWTNESYQLSEKVVYVRNGSELGQGYFDMALPVVKTRIKQGGVRLAFVLNEAARGRTSFKY